MSVDYVRTIICYVRKGYIGRNARSKCLTSEMGAKKLGTN